MLGRHAAPDLALCRQCPKCLVALMPQLPHIGEPAAVRATAVMPFQEGVHPPMLTKCNVAASEHPATLALGCTGGLAAPRQAAKRRRVAMQRDEVGLQVATEQRRLPRMLLRSPRGCRPQHITPGQLSNRQGLRCYTAPIVHSKRCWSLVTDAGNGGSARQVKTSRRCTSAEPPSPDGPPLQLDRSISGPGLCLPHPAAMRGMAPEPSRLGNAARCPFSRFSLSRVPLVRGQHSIMIDTPLQPQSGRQGTGGRPALPTRAWHTPLACTFC